MTRAVVLCLVLLAALVALYPAPRPGQQQGIPVPGTTVAPPPPRDSLGEKDATATALLTWTGAPENVGTDGPGERHKAGEPLALFRDGETSPATGTSAPPSPRSSLATGAKRRTASLGAPQSPALTPTARKEVARTGGPPALPAGRVTGQVGTAEVAGRATYYCGNGSPCTRGFGSECLCAAAGPLLRQVLGGNGYGRHVRVSAGSRSVVVTIVDVCICGSVIDLYAAPFSQLAPLSAGIVQVNVEVLS